MILGSIGFFVLANARVRILHTGGFQFVFFFIKFVYLVYQMLADVRVNRNCCSGHSGSKFWAREFLIFFFSQLFVFGTTNFPWYRSRLIVFIWDKRAWEICAREFYILKLFVFGTLIFFWTRAEGCHLGLFNNVVCIWYIGFFLIPESIEIIVPAKTGGENFARGSFSLACFYNSCLYLVHRTCIDLGVHWNFVLN